MLDLIRSARGKQPLRVYPSGGNTAGIGSAVPARRYAVLFRRGLTAPGSPAILKGSGGRTSREIIDGLRRVEQRTGCPSLHVNDP